MLPPSPPAPTPSYSSKPSDGRVVFLPFFPLVPRLSVRSHSVRGVTNQPANSLLSFLPSLLLLLSFFLSLFLPNQITRFRSIRFDLIRSHSIEFPIYRTVLKITGHPRLQRGNPRNEGFGAKARHTFPSPSDERGTREQWRTDCATFCGIVSRRCVTRTISSVRKRRERKDKGGRARDKEGRRKKVEERGKMGKEEESRRRRAAKARKIGAEERAAWRE